MKSTLITVVIVLVSIGLLACNSKQQIPIHFNLTEMKTEYRTTPIGIDVVTPRFSWQISAQSNTRNLTQTAYKIVVTDENGNAMWNSGIVRSAHSLHIEYEGMPLKPRTRYTWRVTVWDNKGQSNESESFFETGLLDYSMSAWNNAQWIGSPGNKLPLYSDYLPLFKLETQFSIVENGAVAGVIFAANDPRLMNKYKNVYQLENKHNESYFSVTLDVEGLRSGRPAKLNVSRAGYTPTDDPETPIASLAILPSVINKSNQYSTHNIEVRNEYGHLTIALNGQYEFWDQNESTGKFDKSQYGATVLLNPLGNNHDFITYGMLNDIGLYAGPNTRAEFSKLQITNLHSPGRTLFDALTDDSKLVTSPSTSTTHDQSVLFNGSEAGQLLTISPPSVSMPRLRTEFSLQSEKIKKARLYATARGIYEFYINGQKISDDYYNPGLTQYNKTHLYQTYDITNLMVDENAIGVQLAEGWWSGMLGYGNTWNGFGDQQSLLAQIIITYEDGSEKVIVTHPSTWQYDVSGPLLYGSLNMGEVYDGVVAKAQQNWATTSFDDNWQQAEEVSLTHTQSRAVKPNMMEPAQTLDYSDMRLIGQLDAPASEYTTLTAKGVAEVRPGVFVYNLGQNIVGVPRINFSEGTEGNTITVRYAEMLYPELDESGANTGMIMTENYRAALSQDLYTMIDGPQVFQPSFTSHGFQYIEITGLNAPLPVEDVQAVAISSIQKVTASFESSNAKVNKLWSNLVWSNIDNFLSVPTDCPQRNERMGWSGDLNVFAPTATYVSHAGPFLNRHLQAMRDTQSENGRFADIAPVGGGFGGLLWGIAGITVTWETYMQYADKRLLETHYPAMVSYMEYLDTTIDPDTKLITDALLGDWLGPQNWTLGSDYLVTAYHIYALKLMHNIATILDKPKDAQKFLASYSSRYNFFNERFVTDSGDTLGVTYAAGAFNPYARPTEFTVANTLTSYAVGLGTNVFDPDNKTTMISKIKEFVTNPSQDDAGSTFPPYSLMTGFIGTAWVSKALSDNGLSDEAYRLLLNEQYPSWLYPVNQGATTIWERLNGYTVEQGFGGNNNMNSFNHYSFGAIGEWLISHSAGINRTEPGFKTFELRPEIDPKQEVTWVKANYDSPYGRIESHWRVTDSMLTYQVTIPANTSAEVHLPSGMESILIDGEPLGALTENATTEQLTRGFVLGSGKYEITATIPTQH
ncbi:hypothetical protein AltI4_45110 (plasmid) [Alteromonas sp. I4]|nr:hypothetical protein AltI4_45110 [Alteromonas sp. I4]